MTAELMAAGTKPAPMSVDADQVADAVAQAYLRGRWEVWIPAPLRLVGFAMRFVPRAIWRRLPR